MTAIVNGGVYRAHCPCGCGVMVGPIEIADETVDCTPEQKRNAFQRQAYAAFLERCALVRKFSPSDVKVQRCHILERQRSCRR